jgi:hypothetical protein
MNRLDRNIISIKRTIWSNFDKFRTLGVFYLERNAVLNKVASLPEEEIAKIADECREGGVRWRNFVKYLGKIEASLLGEREIIDMSQKSELAFDSDEIKGLVSVRESASGVAVALNLTGKFDILQKGNRNGCFELKNVTVSPETEFTLVNELLPFWEDRYSVALKSDKLSVAISSEDPKTGKKGSACAKIYVIDEKRIRIDDLGKYIDTTALTRWINP